ncbi:MAG: N-acetylglucosamine kinase, partial [Ignavibacteriaceae bacterium]
AGAGRRNDAERLEKNFISFSKTKGIEFEKVLVESDARIALEGAFAGKPGSILIAGTGSIMFGKDANGNIYRIGGFGRFIGDEGSGYSIGKKGLAAVAKEFDGRINETAISELLKEKFKIHSGDILITEIYKNNFEIASAAPLVIKAAENGDAIAGKILDEESDELILHISAMIKKIGQTFLNLSFIGGTISSDNIFSKMLKEKIKTKLPQVNVISPEYSPAVGAVLMAKEILKKELND